MDAERRTFTCGRNDGGRRLDRVLRILLPGLSLSAIYGALRRGRILLNDSRSTPERRLAENDRISVPSEFLSGLGEGTGTSRPPAGPPLPSVQTIYRNEDLLAISKPRGMLSHGPGGADEVVQSLFPPDGSSGLSFRPGPLHRLDRNSSGILCFSLSSFGAREGSLAFREGLVRKVYVALFTGRMLEGMVWEDRLERDGETQVTRASPTGALAKARFFPIAYDNGYSLGAILLETGKTHQIRVQASLRGHPLAGDSKYGGGSQAGGYFLHAWGLSFTGKCASLAPEMKCPFPPEREGTLLKAFGPAILEKAEAALSVLLSDPDQAMGTH